jgi:hypothetical protein
VVDTLLVRGVAYGIARLIDRFDVVPVGKE